MHTIPHLAANVSAKLVQFVVVLIAIPLQLYVFSAASYSLIAIFLSASFLLLFFDFGLSHTVVREMARSVGAKQKNQIEHTRSFYVAAETLTWIIGLTVATIGILSAPILSTHYLTNPENIEANVNWTLRILSVAVGLTAILSFYRNVMIGRNIQVALSSIEIVSAPIKHLGATLIVLLINGDITYYFLIIVVLLIIEILFTKVLGQRELFPRNLGPVIFSLRPILKNWRYALGTGSVSILGSSTSMADTMVLPAILSLEQYSYYMIARYLGRSLFNASQPILRVFRPRYISLVKNAEYAKLQSSLNFSIQLTFVICSPLAAHLVVFNSEILELWTGNNELSESASELLIIFTLGTLAFVPAPFLYYVQQAYGHTLPALYLAAVLFVVVFPLLWILSSIFGAYGAAIVWLIVGISQIGFHAIITTRYFSGNLVLKIAFWTLFKTALTSLIFASLVKLLAPLSLILLGVSFLSCCLLLALVTSDIRAFIRDAFRKIQS